MCSMSAMETTLASAITLKKVVSYDTVILSDMEETATFSMTSWLVLSCDFDQVLASWFMSNLLGSAFTLANRLMVSSNYTSCSLLCCAQ